jgi:hypothetical protein
MRDVFHQFLMNDGCECTTIYVSSLEESRKELLSPKRLLPHEISLPFCEVQ